jgi:tetratricopeptide (TPR) repeat protein
VCALAALSWLAAPAARAQDARADARVRFSRALELYDEGRLDQALAEFQRAYDLAPAAPVLFNLAQVHAELGHSVEAVASYERYLREGGSAIAAERRALVEREIAQQRARIARLSVETNVPGAVVSIDDENVGTAPISDHAVDAGEHVVAARAPGHEGARRRVRIAGGVAETVRLELFETSVPHGFLHIESPVPGIEVTIDGAAIGLTPFDATIPVAPGAHRVVAQRRGYRPIERSIEIAAGADAHVALAPELDPDATGEAVGELRLALPSAHARVGIDGADREATGPIALRLPVGPHDLELEVADRQGFRARIDVAAIGTDLAPALVWTPDAAQSRHTGADVQALVGTLLVASGAALLAPGIGIWLWNQDEWETLVGEYSPWLKACQRTMELPDCDELFAATGFAGNMDEYRDYVNYRRDIRNGVDWTAAILMGVGSALIVAGAVTLFATPSHAAIDRAARARLDLRLGPGSLSVGGSF